VNTLYILDEPSVGLHPRDSQRLVKILQELRAKENTVVVVEHEEEIIREADHIIDIGPGAGERGGEILYAGPYRELLPETRSLTAQYLTGRRRIAVPSKRRRPIRNHELLIRGAREHNLRDVDVHIPLGRFVCVTGVSGSGKSTLMEDVVYRGLRKRLGQFDGVPGAHEDIEGWNRVASVVLVDQSPLGTTRRANPVTYLKAFDPIRDLFAASSLAKLRGFTAATFSFNVAGGRCETCGGEGYEKVEMQFLSDVYVTCQTCNGSRFRADVLEVTVNGKSIREVLDLTAEDAVRFFGEGSDASARLQPLLDVGLGYVRLGQPLTTLSGGESQRLKLAAAFGQQTKGQTLFLFDEPTIGLHFADVETLLTALQSLVERGHSVVVIEHNMEVAKAADWVIDLGPDGGTGGGRVVAEGTPEDVAATAGSHTGRYLAAALAGPTAAQISPEVREAPPAVTNGAGLMRIVGANEHNLKDLHLDLPRDKFIVITGLSGSGKSTLAFDIVYAEGQRRYLDSLSTYARQYVKVLPRPDVDLLAGVPATGRDRAAPEPRLAQVDGRDGHRDLPLPAPALREDRRPALHALRRGAQPAQPRADRGAHQEGVQGRGDDAAGPGGARPQGHLQGALPGGAQARLQAGAHRRQARPARPAPGAGALQRARHRHRRRQRGPRRARGDAVARAHRQRAAPRQRHRRRPRGKREALYSERLYCGRCGVGYEALDPRLFSFNSRQGACTSCDGLGSEATFEVDTLIADADRPIGEALLSALAPGGLATKRVIREVAKRHRISLKRRSASSPPSSARRSSKGTARPACSARSRSWSSRMRPSAKRSRACSASGRA
jgi:excinuclease ABC subunit A